jgi:hypothetical protein
MLLPELICGNLRGKTAVDCHQLSPVSTKCNVLALTVNCMRAALLHQLLLQQQQKHSQRLPVKACASWAKPCSNPMHSPNTCDASPAHDATMRQGSCEVRAFGVAAAHQQKGRVRDRQGTEEVLRCYTN